MQKPINIETILEEIKEQPGPIIRIVTWEQLESDDSKNHVMEIFKFRKVYCKILGTTYYIVGLKYFLKKEQKLNRLYSVYSNED